MFYFLVALLATISAPASDFLAWCRAEGGEVLVAGGECHVLSTQATPLVTFCDRERGVNNWHSLEEVVAVAEKNEPVVAEEVVEWAAWCDNQSIVTVCVAGPIGEYEKSLIWVVETEGEPSARYTAWGVAGDDGVVTHTIIKLGHAADDESARGQLDLLAELKILVFS